MNDRTVLVVEDNPTARKLLRVALESQGCDVREAEDGATALATLQPPPDLVVQDLLLPDMDGIVLREQIRQAPGCAGIPVIAISGHSNSLNGEAARQAGFAARLCKPLEPSRLLAAVRDVLQATHPGPKPASARVVVVDDADVQRKLTVLRLEQEGFEALPATDGAEALELIRRVRPDAVIADVLMPGLDGFELCRALRAEPDPAIAATKVVLASSVFVGREDRELSRRAGADGYVTREADHAAIVSALRRVLGHPLPSRRPQPDGGYDELRSNRLSAALQHESAAHNSLVAALADRDAQLAILSGIAQSLAHTYDPDDAIEGILARSLEAAGVTGASYTPEGGGGAAVSVGQPPARNGSSFVVPVRSDGRDRGEIALGAGGQPLTLLQLDRCRTLAAPLAQAVALARSQGELIASRDRTIERLAHAVALRDGETAGHNQRMSSFCALIASELALDAAHCLQLRSASAMHDIGKVAIPDAVLLKPGPLSPEERAEMERHAELGHRILSGSGSELLELAASIALHHHEHWDGGGYPRRLSGEAIPLDARIAAVADVFDALTSDRPYRRAMSVEEALRTMRLGRGTHFDPTVFDAFERALPLITAVG